MTANAFKNVEKSTPETASEFDIDAVVETSVSCFGEQQVCFQVALVDAREDKQLWFYDFNVEISQIPNLLRALAKDIASEINVTLNPREEELLAETVTVDPEAYDYYMKGQFYLNKMTPESLDSAMLYFEMAKEKDPDYALAYTGICDVWAYRQTIGLVAPAEGNFKSMEAVMKAYSLDSSNAVVQYTLAHKKTFGTYDWVGGEVGFKESISLNPNNAMTHTMYSALLSFLGRHDKALEHSNIGRSLDPKNHFIITINGANLYMARKYDEAIIAYKNALSLEPGFSMSLFLLWQTYYKAGRTEEAYVTLKSLWSMDPELVKSFEQGYLENDVRGAFLSLADRLAEIWIANQNQLFAPTDIAWLYSAGEESDECIYWLEQAYKIRDVNIPFLIHPILDHIRPDPRFKDLCERMNLQHAAVVN